MKNYTKYLDSYFNVVSIELLDEGIISDIGNKFKSLASTIKNKLEKIKGSAELMAIKALNSVEGIKEFIKKHPNTVWLVFAAIIAGYLILPKEAHAALASPDQVKDLATSMPIELIGTVQNPSISINATTPQFTEFFKKILDISLAGNTNPADTLQHIIANFGDSLKEFLLKSDLFKKIHETDPSKAKEIFTFAYNKIAKTLMDKTLSVI